MAALLPASLVLARWCCRLRRRSAATTTRPASASAVGPIVKGPRGVWLFQPAGKPKNVVVYFHGQGGPVEATPKNHRPWIDHLVSRGSIVVYPRYELNYEIDPVLYALQGVQTAMKRVKNADKLPVAVDRLLARGRDRPARVRRRSQPATTRRCPTR